MTVLDEVGNVAPGYTGTVVFTASDGSATTPSSYTFVGADAGVHVFVDGVTFETAGEHNVTVTDVLEGTITGSQTGITVQPAGAATLSVTGIADPVTAGAASDMTLTVLDPFGDVATGYTGTVTFTSSDGPATLPANYTFTGGVTFETVGEQSVTATDIAAGSITGSQVSITVEPSGAESLSVMGIIDPIRSGVALDVTVTALDPFGNVATGYLGTVAFTSSDGSALLPTNYAFTGADNGVHVFVDGVTLVTQGDQSVTVTDVAVGTITGGQVDITVEPPAPTSLAFDFEGGTLDGWTVGGRRGGSANIAEVVDRNSSLKAHLYHQSWEEIMLLSTEWAYGADFRVSFEMETAVTSSFVSFSIFYASASVTVAFLDASATTLGYVAYTHSTSSVAFQGCDSSATCSRNSLASGSATVYDLTATDLLGQITINEGAIAFVRVSFTAFGSDFSDSLSAHVWFDDLRYEAAGWAGPAEVPDN